MNNKKKILFMLHIPPPVHGSSIVGLSIKNSKLINRSFDCSYVNLLVSRKINETGKFKAFKIIRFLCVWFELFIHIIRNRPDICYLALSTKGLSFYKDVFLVALLRIFRIKRIYHLHNKGVSQYEANLIDNLFYHFVFNNAAVIILSNKLYPDIRKYVSISNIYVCPNGVPDSFYNSKDEKIQRRAVPRILFLSNLIESKGVYDLLDACKILHNKGIDFNCNFIGAESDINVAQFNGRVKQNGLFGKVNYLGEKFGEEKNELLLNSDIFAFPTYYHNECFPLVLLEAMSANLPVISTSEGGIPDIIDDGVTGFIVPQRNVNELAEKLKILILDAQLQQTMGKAGREKFENKFMLEKFEHTLDDILNDFLLRN